MSKDEALNLALQALENTTPTGFNMERDKQFFASITAIKEALVQPEPWEKFCDSNCVWTDHHPDCKLAEQEPVAWLQIGLAPLHDGDVIARTVKPKDWNPEWWRFEPLYTTPPQRTWVGLTWEDTNEIAIEHDVRPSIVKAIEAKLKEKNT